MTLTCVPRTDDAGPPASRALWGPGDALIDPLTPTARGVEEKGMDFFPDGAPAAALRGIVPLGAELLPGARLLSEQ